ncbi:flagellar basal body-associated FliL family protein [Litoreibacter sp.]|nr:flagellar basal body-associated FliL family protein [Litoreibacter sp.]
MSETEETEETAPAPKSKKGLVIGLVLALALGGGSFFAVYSGMVLGHSEEVASDDMPLEDMQPATFVAMTPLVVSLGSRSNYQLRFNAELEVEPSKQGDVENLMPRILDVLNGYLRAVDVRELQDPTALIRLRAQMLRRIQLVTGTGHVRDLLITEFVFT